MSPTWGKAVARPQAAFWSGSVVVRRFYIEDLKVIKPGRLQHLAENRVDKYRAAISDEIGIAYDLALATLHGDI